MKTLIVQKDIGNSDLESYLRIAEERSVDIVCFGELSTSGCLYSGGQGEELDSIFNRLAGFDVAVMLGFPRRHDDHLFNSYLYYHKGSFQVYDKINLFEPMNEQQHYQPGIGQGLFDTAFGLLGVAICYDLRFPELFAQLKLSGASRIFVPAAFPAVRIGDWERLLVERAVENQVWVIGINAVGDDGRNRFGGRSMVISPSGKVLVEAGGEKPEILEVEL